MHIFITKLVVSIMYQNTMYWFDKHSLTSTQIKSDTMLNTSLLKKTLFTYDTLQNLLYWTMSKINCINASVIWTRYWMVCKVIGIQAGSHCNQSGSSINVSYNVLRQHYVAMHQQVMMGVYHVIQYFLHQLTTCIRIIHWHLIYMSHLCVLCSANKF